MVSICFFEKCGPCDFVHDQLYFTVLYTKYTMQPYVLNSWCCFGFWMSEVCLCINLLIYFEHHLSEVQNDHGGTTNLGSVQSIGLLAGLSSYAAGECRTKDLV